MGWTEPTPGAFTLSPCFPTAVRATSQGGDLMSDLFNKLAMRRTGRKQDPGAASFLTVFRSLGPGWPGAPDPLLTPASALPGISGKGPGSGASEGPGGAFARMSDSIPPLPPPQQPLGEEDEDDWES